MASASPGDLQSFVSRVHLAGSTGGRVKTLPPFDKSRHVVPDAINAATTGFLAKLVSTLLAEEAETLFQQTRAALAYKRRDLSLDVSSPTAVLTAKDFTLRLEYALEPGAPDEYRLTRTLDQLAHAELVQRPAFDELLAGQFNEVGFLLKKGVRVEAVIDAVEALEGTPLHVEYPSDCRSCTLQVEGVAAEVICDGASLAMRFPRPGSPRELLEAFAAVRQAFALTKERALAGLLG